MNILCSFIVINGFYDIFCAIYLVTFKKHTLWLNDICHKTIHTGMFTNDLSCKERRLLAYWIFTYGYMRLCTGFTFQKYDEFSFNHPLLLTAAASYFLEGTLFEIEAMCSKTMIMWKVHAVALVCFLLGTLVICLKDTDKK